MAERPTYKTSASARLHEAWKHASEAEDSAERLVLVRAEMLVEPRAARGSKARLREAVEERAKARALRQMIGELGDGGADMTAVAKAEGR